MKLWQLFQKKPAKKPSNHSPKNQSRSTGWVNPDAIWTNFNDVVVFIYDKKNDKLISTSKRATHFNLIDCYLKYFYDLLNEEDPSHTFPEYKTLVKMGEAKNRYHYKVALDEIRQRLQFKCSNRLTFGRSGRDPKTGIYYHSFWRDYPQSLINSTASKINDKYSLNPKDQMISTPSGTVKLGVNIAYAKDSEDIAMDQLRLHLMPASQKKAELFKAGAKPKGVNPWRQEAMKLAKGYQEPWRLTSESKTKHKSPEQDR